VRPFPWFGKARAREALRALSGHLPEDPAWLDGERVEEPVKKPDSSECLVCGTPGEPIPTSSGLAWSILVCPDCTAEVASRALRRMVPKLLRAKLES
jgi:hypothetical protein